MAYTLRLLAFVASLIAAIPSVAGFHVLHFSDFHYDPYFGTSKAIGPCRTAEVSKYGLPGCDSSKTIVESSLRDAASLAANLTGPVVLLYTGDWLRHDMASLDDPSRVGKEIMTTLSGLIRKYFPSTGGKYLLAPHAAVPIALGNEDFIPDYHFNVSNAGHDALLHGFADIFNDTLLTAVEADQFRHCAFYHRTFDLSQHGLTFNLRVISLNTLVWAFQITPSTNSMSDPCGQFAWLEAQLATAKSNGEKVYIQSHIPPDFYDSQFEERYVSIIKQYNDIIEAQFFGHIHRMSYLSLSSKKDEVPPLFIGGPITRVSATNPCYEVVKLNNTDASVESVTQRYLSSSFIWTTGHTIPDAYNITSLSNYNLYQVGEAMRHESGRSLFDVWYTMYNGGIVSKEKLDKCDIICQRFLACTLVAVGAVPGGECILNRKMPRWNALGDL